MTAARKSSCIVLVLVCVLGWAGRSAGADVPAAGGEKTATRPGRMARYYGFAPMEIIKLEWGIGEPIVADVNADGLNDLVLVNNRKARIELLLQKKDFKPDLKVPVEPVEDDVNDIFGREKTWRFRRCSFELDVAATSLAVADLNSDGRLDLAFYAKDGLRVALQDARAPAAPAGGKDAAAPRKPAWLATRKIDVRGGLAAAAALAAGDLNGDRRTDLALLADDGTFVILQKADGSLAQPEKHHCASRPGRIFVADVDADGRADLVILTGEQEFPVRVRHQTTAGVLGPEVRYRMPAPRALALARLRRGTRSYFLSVSQISGRVRVSALTGSTRRAEYPVFTYPLPGTAAADKRDVVAADLDGDGLADVVASDPSRAEFLLFRAGAEGGLASPRRFPGLTDMQKLAAADLDGAGRDAIVALSPKEKIIAVSRLTKGRLSFPESVKTTDEPVAMDLADVNGDGKADLLYIAKQKKTGKYYLRTVLGVGRKDARPGDEIELTELRDKPLDIRAGDIDHDGRVDVMIVRPYGPVQLVRRRAEGGFAQVTRRDVHSGLVANVFPAALSLAPLGPGGKTAALLAKKNFARAVIFDTEKGWQVVDQYQAVSRDSILSAAAACRLPGGKHLAIVTYDSARGKMGILTRRADGTYRTEREVKVGSVTVRKILTGNFGGKSPLSILLCGTHKLIRVSVSGRMSLLRKLASYEPKLKGARYGIVAAGDLNADGVPELVLLDQAGHHVEILAFDPAGGLTSASKFKVFEAPRSMERSRYDPGGPRSAGQPRAVRIADVTGDGKSDLILLVHDRLIVYPQD